MNKKINVIVLGIVLSVCVVFLVSLFMKGRGIYFQGLKEAGNRATNFDVASCEDATKESQVDARYLQKNREINLQEKDYYYSYPNDKLAWYIKRDNDHGPSGCDMTLNLSEYGAYYLDMRRWQEDDKTTGDAESSEEMVEAGEESESSEEMEEISKMAEQPVIYLTFDCGYENGFTESMLDVLKKEDVPACFFVTQTYIRDNIDIVKRMKEEGHQVGNHTITHPSLPSRSFEEIVQELNGCADYMKEATGYEMDPYFRPPSGEYSARVLKIAQDLGYETIFWSIVYLDYDVNKQPGADYVIEHFNKYHHDGAIVLMHNCSSSNAEALETVIENMKMCGYRFASLNELE